MTHSENRPFLTIKEVSKLIGLSVSTINRLIKKRDFPSKAKISPRRMVFFEKGNRRMDKFKMRIDKKKVLFKKNHI